MQPGDTITPGNKSDDATEISIPRDDNPVSQTKPHESLSIPEKSKKHTESAPEPAVIQNEPIEEPSPWQYSHEATDESDIPELSPIEWTASEFVDHEKDISWFMGFAALTGLAVAVIYLITRELITALVIIITASLFAVSAKRKPQTLHYKMDRAGISVGSRFYNYDGFKSFSVLEEGAFSSIQLSPLKRLAIPISLFYAPEDEEKIIAMLGSFLPHELRSHDPVDRLMRKVRF